MILGAAAPESVQQKHVRSLLKKQKLLSRQLQIAGTGALLPVVPPGLTLTRPLIAYQHTLTFAYEVSSPSHILQSCLCFRLPSEVHSSFAFSAAIPPSAALCKNGLKEYSLFFNGLQHHTTVCSHCQAANLRAPFTLCVDRVELR